MSLDLRPATPAEARAAIANTLLDHAKLSARLGEVTLYDHQLSAAARLLALLDVHRGALLCDAVGLGKTYTALAVARQIGTFTIVAPAVVREMWRDAIARTELRAIGIVSHEALSCGSDVPGSVDLVIVDEAHGFRNSGARRYPKLALAAARARILLLSATPLHNARDDLVALVALFLGSRAHAMTDDDLARLIVRRDTAPVASPAVIRTPAHEIALDDRVTHAILALPPPVPARDGRAAAVLVACNLLRAWASSGAALEAALRRRTARALAMLDGLDSRRYPTRDELRAWVIADDSTQLTFVELIATETSAPLALRAALATHLAAIRELLTLVRESDDVARRAAWVRQIHDTHPDEKIVAFASHASTATALYYGLRRHARAALITARGGLIATGRVARRDVLCAFAPRATSSREAPEAERIDVLVTTDLLGEGVNLQDASIVVHLDLPWSAARIDQRTGRLARLGSVHATVRAFELRPDQSVEDALHLVETIARKRQIAVGMLGDGVRRGVVSERERLLEILREWIGTGTVAISGDVCVVADVVADIRGALAAGVLDGESFLVYVNQRGAVTSDIGDVLAAAERLHCRNECAGAPNPPANEVRAVIEGWACTRRAARAAGLDGSRERSIAAPTRLWSRRRTGIRNFELTASSASFANRYGAARAEADAKDALSRPLPIALEGAIIAGSAHEVGQSPSVTEQLEVTAIVMFVR